MKLIDAEKLIAEIEKRKAPFKKDMEDGVYPTYLCALMDFEDLITSLQQEQDMGEVSDGYHTFNELYYYRMLYNAAFFNLLPKSWVHKSKRHHTGEECFGGGWFIVMANLPTGQISNHYELKNWDLFQVPEKEFADEWDGHTPQEVAERLKRYLQQEQLETDVKSPFTGGKVAILLREEEVTFRGEKVKITRKYYRCEDTGREFTDDKLDDDMMWTAFRAYCEKKGMTSFTDIMLKQEQPEVKLENEIDEKWDEFVSSEGERDDFTKIAHHFYELGLNARKEE